MNEKKHANEKYTNEKVRKNSFKQKKCIRIKSIRI